MSLLQSVDTPTVCNAVEVVDGKRGFDRFTRGTPFASHPDAPAIVGHARTAKISGAEPPTDAQETIRARRMDYYRYMADAASPALAVVEDMDGDSAVSAYWGEINANVHKGLGLVGALTNGLVRDLSDLPDGFPVIAGSTGPSHAFVHVREIDTPVTVFGLDIAPGELVHADRHGAVVVPAYAIAELESAVKKLLETEKIVLDAARAPGFDFAAFETAWSAFEARRT